MFGNFSYLIYNFLFGGSVALILIILYRPLFVKHFSIIARASLILIPIAILLDSNAVQTGTWFYPNDKNLGIGFFDSPIETSIFGVIMVTIVCMLTFVFLDLEEKKAPRETWVRTILGISSLGLVTFATMLLLRYLVNY